MSKKENVINPNLFLSGNVGDDNEFIPIITDEDDETAQSFVVPQRIRNNSPPKIRQPFQTFLILLVLDNIKSKYFAQRYFLTRSLTIN